VDSTPPTVDDVAVDGGADWVAGRQVTLTITAFDEEGGSGVTDIAVIEYALVEAQWVQVGGSGWVPYAEALSGVVWLLSPEPGARYLHVYAADAAGNVSPQPFVRAVNLISPGSVVRQGEVHVYRLVLASGSSLTLRSSGDADLYVWDRSGNLVASAVTDVQPEVTIPGGRELQTYQVEVEGSEAAAYDLQVAHGTSAAYDEPMVSSQMRLQPIISPSETPLPVRPWSPQRVYLPAVGR
jgi:hypothetical protein